VSIAFDTETAVLQPAEIQPQQVRANVRRVINLVIPDLSLGGAERIVVELIRGWRNLARSGNISKVTLFVLSSAKDTYPIQSEHPHVKIVSLAHLRPARRLRMLAKLIRATGNNYAFTHLIGMDGLRTLWELGVRTMPVIHNTEERWNCVPDAFDPIGTPAVFAVCRQVAGALRAAGCQVPIHTVKHELLPRKAVNPELRQQVRRELDIPEDALLIGMVGKFKRHKRFPFAIEVLNALTRNAKACLAIVGPQRTPNSDQTDEFTAVQTVANALGVQDRVHLLDATSDIDHLYPTFDVYLNTSSCEGMSIAVMEAQAHGIPCVLSDVGGQSEVAADADILVDESAPAHVYAEAVLRASETSDRPQKRRFSHGLVPRLWGWIASHGIETGSPPGEQVLFITNNLGQGGAQRSLVNMLAATGGKLPCALCLLGPSYSSDHQRLLEQSHIPLCSLDGISTYDKVNTLLEIAAGMNVGTICFWNVEARIKLLIVKVLSARSLKIVDVSPGPKLFSALESARSFGNRIAFAPEEYLSRLDTFVSKYQEGGVPRSMGAAPRKSVVIPNGVVIPIKQRSSALALRPANVSPEHAVVTTGRIVPAKMVERMFAVFERLVQLEPRATLTIIGKVEGDPNRGYWNRLQQLYQAMKLENVVYFLGENTSAKNSLSEFCAFMMLSRDQGCPNASLEAMACALPVVANPDGGTTEQVLDGLTGFLVDESRPDEIAHRLKWIFDNPEAAATMGERGKERALSLFSIEKMQLAYEQLLWPSINETSHPGSNANEGGVGEREFVEENT
jgi:glycosyltransferase involved in cell wall biosynthesis